MGLTLQDIPNAIGFFQDVLIREIEDEAEIMYFYRLNNVIIRDALNRFNVRYKEELIWK